MMNTTTDLKDDLLNGAFAIGEFIDKTERQTYYIAERRLLPIFRIGRMLHARKSELTAAMSGQRVPRRSTSEIAAGDDAPVPDRAA